jgi:hypothetical protein
MTNIKRSGNIKYQISNIKSQGDAAAGPAAVRSLLVLLVLAGIASATRYAGDFEELGVSARSVGMGSAFVAVGADPAALYYNPSASALLERRSVLLMHAENFGGLVKNDFASFVLPSEKSALGFGLLYNGVSDIKLTRLLDPNRPVGVEFESLAVVTKDTVVNGRTYYAGDTLREWYQNVPEVDRIVSAADWVFYFNYARPLGNHFLVGGNAKLIYRTTGVSTCFGMGLDLGATMILVKDLNVGLRVRNLATSPLFWDTKTRESMDPRPVLGISKGFKPGKDHRFVVSIEGEGNFEGLPIEQNLGVEYEFRRILSGRIGFHRSNFTFGLGGRYKSFFLDYAYETASYADSRDLPPTQKIAGGVQF